ncbi:MAG: hypothetical protein NTY51_09110 [Deltaproteobacteria bacterium]|nr:hypothetical protein [Deltaproteobacteria bacterium]
MGLLSYKLSALDLRQELVDLVEREILGPAGGPEEEIDEPRVKDRYLIGCLAPKDSMTVPEEIDDSAIGGDMTDDGQADSKPIERATFLQSSFGFTLIVEADAPKLRIGARWGHYTRQVENRNQGFHRYKLSIRFDAWMLPETSLRLKKEQLCGNKIC